MVLTSQNTLIGLTRFLRCLRTTPKGQIKFTHFLKVLNLWPRSIVGGGLPIHEPVYKSYVRKPDLNWIQDYNQSNPSFMNNNIFCSLLRQENAFPTAECREAFNQCYRSRFVWIRFISASRILIRIRLAKISKLSKN